MQNRIRGLGVVAGALIAATGMAGAAEEAPPKDNNAHVKKLDKRMRDLERRMADRDEALARIEKQLDKLLGGQAPGARRGGDGADGPAREQLDQLRRRWEGAFGGRGFGGRVGPRAFFQTNKPWLGVYIEEVPAEMGGQTGAHVTRVVPGSPADKAGIMPQDIITKFGGTRIDSPNDLTSAVRDRRVGEETNIALIRDGEKKIIGVALDARRQGIGGELELRLGDELGELFEGQGLEGLKDQLGGAMQQLRIVGDKASIRSTATHGDHTVTLGVTGAPLQFTSRMRMRLKLSLEQRRAASKIHASARKDLMRIISHSAKATAKAGGKFDFDALDKELDTFESDLEKKLAESLTAEQIQIYRDLKRSGPVRSVSVERTRAKPLPQVKPEKKQGKKAAPADLDFF